jgi:signal transduction histidine kinase
VDGYAQGLNHSFPAYSSTYSANHKEMIKVRFPLFLFFLMLTLQVSPQDKVKVDSLEKLLKKAKIDTVKADLFNQLFVEHINSDTSMARDFANQAFRLSSRSEYSRGIANSYLNLANLELAGENYRKARNYIQRSIDLLEDVGDLKAVAAGYHGMGHCLFLLQDHNLSLEYYNEALKIREEIRDTIGLKESYKYLGSLYNGHGNFPLALEHFHKLMALCEAAGDVRGMAECYTSIGWNLSNQGNTYEALVNFQKALETFEILSDSSRMADCMNNMGLIYEYQGDYPRALEIYYKTFEYREVLGERSGQGLCYHNIGNIYYKMDDTARALNYYKRALVIRTELGERGPMASTFIGLGNVNLAKEEYSRALDYYEQALKIAEEIGSIPRTALINGQIGSVYLEMKDYPKAISHGLKGYHLGSDAGVKEAVRDAAETLAGSYAATGSYKKAYDYYNIFKTLSDSLLNAENIRDIRARENQYQYEKEQQIARLENLKREEVYAAEVKKQQMLKNAFIGAFAMMIIIAALILRSYRCKQKANIALQEKNLYISQQKEEIEAQRDEIEQQKEELQITLDHLKNTQEQLIQSEKLAALGGLVAGVAHEINTPVGISVTAASSLAEETSRMAEQYVTNKISRAEFKEYLNTANQSAKLILANMERTATMVQSFMQVSVDQSTEQKRNFKLKEYSEDVIRSLYPKLKGKRIKIKVEIDDQLELNSYPGAFSQIITNLVLNSLVHGFENKDLGNINISMRQEDGNLFFEYRDDGKGIANQNLNKIFDPFYTTNNKIGTGLGLHIVYNLVTQKLNGSITCSSEKEKGVSFRMKIPASNNISIR